ncbi:Trans-resveratrol di-O-methyltransferase [Linum perenne]
MGSINNGNTISELLEAQSHVWHNTFNFVTSMSLKCAVQLGIPDAVNSHGKPITLPDLVAALKIPPTKTPYLHRLVRVLVHSGFLSVSDDDVHAGSSYSLTRAGQLLVKENPFNTRALVVMILDPDMCKPYHFMSAWFRSETDDETTPYYIAHGKKVIATSFPEMDCTVLDLPHVVSGLEGGGNLKYVAGDMFDDIPPAEVALLKWILHDWSDENCVKILKNCRKAITSNNKSGKVIIIDMVLSDQKWDEKSITTQFGLDMEMMVVQNGKERNEEELQKLFKESGFSSYHINPILGIRALIELYP